MMGYRELLTPIKPQAHEHIIDELIRAYESSSEDEALPDVTLLLSSGQSLSGVIACGVQVDSTSPHRMLLIHLDRNASVAYVPESWITGIVVERAIDHREILTFGEIEDDDEPAPSALKIKRRMRDLSDELSDQIGKSFDIQGDFESIPSTDAARRSLSKQVEQVAKAISTLIDRFGQSAVAESLSKIVIEHGEKRVGTQDSAVVVACEFLRGRGGRFGSDTLAERIAAVL